MYEHIKNEVHDPLESSQFPYFDLASSERNVSAFVGQTTHLHCVVRELGDKTVRTTLQDICLYRQYLNLKWSSTGQGCPKIAPLPNITRGSIIIFVVVADYGNPERYF